MKKNKFKKHEQKWARMALVWEEFAKPGRPSKDDIKNYELLLNIVVRDTVAADNDVVVYKFISKLK
ncbi:hypothetical protein CO115_04255 [Candidatus Falkowbacteria bacterium CG_4_9_14_3_um_filter_36_9]|nr:MAG: hypothetical protein CO115_04255 [Candidatus Falkowbacteria bacterium CG_4_9_14_3_um_filter_36_9]